MLKATRCFVYEGKEVHAVGDCLVPEGMFTTSQLQRLTSLGLVREVPEDDVPLEVQPKPKLKPIPKSTPKPAPSKVEPEYEDLEEPEIEKVATVKKSKRSSFAKIP